MTTAIAQEVSGTLSANPLAELLAEISDHGFDGALRLTEHANKTVVYFKNGRVVYAVSNQKKHRLFQLVLESGLVNQEVVVKIPEFTNDVVFAKTLVDAGFVPEATLVGIVNHQVREIIREAFYWHEGGWTFSPLARVKEEMHRRLEIPTLLMAYARGLKPVQIGRRFNSFNETFQPSGSPPAHVSLLPEETFLLTAYDGKEKSLAELAADAQMRDHHLIKTIYSLWLGGFLKSVKRKHCFTASQVEMLSTAKVTAKKKSQANAHSVSVLELNVEAISGLANSEQEKRAREISLEVFLRQVENAADHYETLNIPSTSSSEEIKKTYFALAKKFHPDRFYRQIDDKMMRRVQNAFSSIADAYNTLRREDTRKTYDFKIGKNQGDSPVPRYDKPKAKLNTQATDEAQKSFDSGFTLLINKQNAAAVPHFARAVDLSPNVPRFHAYYARALATDGSTRFKAETHFQTAITLEPQNTQFRLMFAEFLAGQELNKRAEAELERLLKIDPNHYDARAMLDSLRN